MIPATYLNQLLELGLWYSPPMLCFGGGVRIYKPVSAGGNSIPDYEPSGLVTLADDEKDEQASHPPQPNSDASPVAFYNYNGKWVVMGVDCVGKMGPADFVGIWDTPEEAMADIKDFYFGNPERMNAKAAFHQDPLGEIEKARSENRMPKWPWN